MSDFSLNAIQLAGSVTVVGQTVDNPIEDVSLTYGYVDASRGVIDASSDLLVTEAAKPTNYINLVGDINAFVSHLASSDSSLNDDAWGLNKITTNGAVSVDNTTVNLSLTDTASITKDFSFSLVTTTQSEQIQVGRTTLSDDGTATGKINGDTDATWYYKVVADLDTTGTLTFSHILYDNSKSIAVDSSVESSLLAQQLYISQIWSSVNGTSSQSSTLDVSGADNFEVTFDTTSQDSAMRSALDASLADVSGEIFLTSVNFTVDAVSQDNESLFSQMG